MANVNNVRGDKFIFTIKNVTGVALVIALLAAFFDTRVAGSLALTNPAEIVKAGYACDAVLDDGIVIDGATSGEDLIVTPINSKKTYRAFREYIKQNSRAIKNMTVQTTNLAAFNQTMEFIDCSPLGSDKVTSIPLVALRDGMSNLNDVVNLDGDGLAVGFDTLVLLPILDGHELTVTFWF